MALGGQLRRRAVRVPVALPAVALVMPGADRPRYPHPSRIAVAWNDGFVETWPAADLGVTEEQLAADAEMGGLVLGPERQRGQVLSGIAATRPRSSPASWAQALRPRRLLVRRRGMGFDLSDLQALMGGSFEEPTGETGGVWVVTPDGTIDDGMLRLIGKGRVVADALGGYVYLLAGCNAAGARHGGRHPGGSDKVLTAGGVPGVNDLAEFFRERQPQAVLLPRTQLGRSLAPGLAQLLGGSLCRYAADLAVDAIYQRIVAHQPVLDDAARVQVQLARQPAVVLMETSPAAARVQGSLAAGRSERHGTELGRAADVRDGRPAARSP